jgi:hypothetical protein
MVFGLNPGGKMGQFFANLAAQPGGITTGSAAVGSTAAGSAVVGNGQPFPPYPTGTAGIRGTGTAAVRTGSIASLTPFNSAAEPPMMAEALLLFVFVSSITVACFHFS